jgi:choline dehydrogenase-like flavoprotein
MPINLKLVDVAVVGLGAAGGVAVLPLARAGLKVAGIEAGTWMDPHSFRPDEIHNNVKPVRADTLGRRPSLLNTILRDTDFTDLTGRP